MALDATFIDLLACPDSLEKLRAADAALLERVNAAITAGRLRTRAGATVSEPLAAGLVRADGKLLYPVVDGTPVLFVDAGIPIAEL